MTNDLRVADPVMQKILIAAVASLLGACSPADPVADAIAAGNELNNTVQKCVDHMKAKQGDTGIPECNAMLQQATYSQAKAKVKTPSPALDAIDQKSMQLRQQAVSLLQQPAN